jgi:SAM-dependent methyltransferase
MYDSTFYDVIRDGIQRSAAEIAPLVFEVVKPFSVVDVGCGEGWWAKAFSDIGCDVVGIDGEYVNPTEIVDISSIAHDIEQPMGDVITRAFDMVGGRFDLAVCLEVAEHLRPERAESFVADLCKLAPVILFSAAIPGQGGTGHINEQWPDYWQALFDTQEFSMSGILRLSIWGSDKIENWYQQNLMICAQRPIAKHLWSLFNNPLMSNPISIVHPTLYNARRL